MTHNMAIGRAYRCACCRGCKTPRLVHLTDAGKIRVCMVAGKKGIFRIAINLELLLNVAVHPANIQDRDGVALVLDQRTRRLFPSIERIFGDGGYKPESHESRCPNRRLDDRHLSSAATRRPR